MQLDQLLQGSNVYVLLGVCCCGLCVVGLVFSIAAPFLDIVTGLLGMVADFAGGLFGIGPIPGCGCGLALAVGIGVVVVGLIAATILGACGSAQATNFCTIFGR